MKPDDLVIYTKSHHKVLCEYKKTPIPMFGLGQDQSRIQNVGRVIDAGRGWVTVRWMKSGKITNHFPDNLELLLRRS